MVAQYGVMGIVMGIRRRIPHWASRLIFVVVGADSRVAFASHIRFVPHPVDNAGIRTCLILIPVMLGFVFGLLTLLLHRGFHVRGIDPNEPVDVRDLLLRFAYPAGAFCITATLVSLISSLAFWLANGSLESADSVMSGLM